MEIPQLYQPWRGLQIFLEKPMVTFTGPSRSDTIQLRNHSDVASTFKLRTTCVERYKVSPCLGLIPAGGRAAISVTYRPPKRGGDERAHLNDRFELFVRPLSSVEETGVEMYGKGDEVAARTLLDMPATPATNSSASAIFKFLWSSANSNAGPAAVPASVALPAVFTLLRSDVPPNHPSTATAMNHPSGVPDRGSLASVSFTAASHNGMVQSGAGQTPPSSHASTPSAVPAVHEAGARSSLHESRSSLPLEAASRSSLHEAGTRSSLPHAMPGVLVATDAQVGARKPKSAKRASIALSHISLGSTVEVTGLHTTAELNGETGRVIGYQEGADNSSPRSASEMLVQVEFNDTAAMALRPSNLIILRESGAPPPPPPQQQQQQQHALSNEVAMDGAEYSPTPSSASTGTQQPRYEPQKLKMMFQAIDTNNDGKITRAELIRALKVNPNVRDLLGIDDVSQQKNIKEFERFFQAADTDNDRSIVWEEFLAICTSDYRLNRTVTRMESCPPSAAATPAAPPISARRPPPARQQPTHTAAADAHRITFPAPSERHGLPRVPSSDDSCATDDTRTLHEARHISDGEPGTPIPPASANDAAAALRIADAAAASGRWEQHPPSSAAAAGNADAPLRIGGGGRSRASSTAVRQDRIAGLVPGSLPLAHLIADEAEALAATNGHLSNTRASVASGPAASASASASALPPQVPLALRDARAPPSVAASAAAVEHISRTSASHHDATVSSKRSVPHSFVSSQQQSQHALPPRPSHHAAATQMPSAPPSAALYETAGGGSGAPRPSYAGPSAAAPTSLETARSHASAATPQPAAERPMPDPRDPIFAAGQPQPLSAEAAALSARWPQPHQQQQHVEPPTRRRAGEAPSSESRCLSPARAPIPPWFQQAAQQQLQAQYQQQPRQQQPQPLQLQPHPHPQHAPAPYYPREPSYAVSSSRDASSSASSEGRSKKSRRAQSPPQHKALEVLLKTALKQERRIEGLVQGVLQAAPHVCLPHTPFCWLICCLR